MAMDLFIAFSLSVLILGALASVFGVDSRPGLNDHRRNV
jgi:hypothetical protein